MREPGERLPFAAEPGEEEVGIHPRGGPVSPPPVPDTDRRRARRERRCPCRRAPVPSPGGKARRAPARRRQCSRHETIERDMDPSTNPPGGLIAGEERRLRASGPRPLPHASSQAPRWSGDSRLMKQILDLLPAFGRHAGQCDSFRDAATPPPCAARGLRLPRRFPEPERSRRRSSRRRSAARSPWLCARRRRRVP